MLKYILFFLLFFQCSYSIDSNDVEVQVTKLEKIDNNYRCKLNVLLRGGWKIYGNVKFSSPSCEGVTFEEGRKVAANVYKSTLIIPDTGQQKLTLKAEFPACSEKMCAFVEKDFQVHLLENGSSLFDFLYILLLALLGGLVLNCMPCVLPVLSLKIHSILSRSGDRKHMLHTWYGIQISFIAFTACIAVLKQLGHSVGWGMHFQNVYFLNVATLLVFLFVLCIYGRINLFVSASDSQFPNSRNAMLQDIYSGILATILAIPCTAPFLGTAAAVALSSSMTKLIAIFLCIGFGFGAPYLLLYFFKININIKQGKWMEILKQVLGVGIAITFVWLAWLLSNHLNVCQMILLAACYLAILLFSKKSLAICILSCVVACLSPILMKGCGRMCSVESVEGNKMWQSFDPLKLQEYIKDGRVIFVNVTADWCMTCKYNKSVLLGTDDFHDLITKHNVICMEGDLTYNNDMVALFLKLHNQSGIPFNIVFGPNAQSGIKLSVIPSLNEVEQAIKKAM